MICAACKRAPETVAPSKEPGAQTQATVMRIHTTIGDDTSLHTIVIAGDKARVLSELDTWRLFDLKAKTVTYVDDISKTTRTESLDSLLRSRQATLAAALPAHYPRATIKHTGARRAMQNMSLEQTVIESGTYRRELWFAENTLVPPGLFGMMVASEPPSSPLAPMMRAADEWLTRTRGFPIIDRAEIPGQLLVEHKVVGISKGGVAASVFETPRGYEDLTPKPAAAKKTK